MSVRRGLAYGTATMALCACSVVTRFDDLVPSADTLRADAATSVADAAATTQPGMDSDDTGAAVPGPLDATSPGDDASGAGVMDGGSAADAAEAGPSPLYAACDEYYKNWVARCWFAAYPASEIQRVESRWNSYCASDVNLMGVSYTAPELQACAQAMSTVSCDDQTTPDACFPVMEGTLAGNAPCLDNAQCQSGSCNLGGASSSCSVCAILVADGQQCGTTNSLCSLNSSCTPENGESICTAGLANLTDEGGSCSSNNDCANGLSCSSNGFCVVPVLAAQGASCDNENTLCLVGFCSNAVDGGANEGVCPTVIDDGKPCEPSSSTTTCDDFAYCVSGVCVLALTSNLCP
jgi:hypothetical protein